MSKHYIHILSNTHWDREWYMSHEKYLVRLVNLMDRLLDIMKTNPDFIFISDGQFSMIDDYLSVRPEKSDEVKKYVSEGRLEVGPWFTQPLETLVSGEAMVRNLHYGIEGSEKLGRAMRFSYEVDEFGHASQTPQVLGGFGIKGALAWRGVPGGCKSAFEWIAPDGTSIVMMNTNGGYGEATALPQSFEDFDETLDYRIIPRKGLDNRIKEIQNLRVPRSDSDHLLWLNGIDHSFAQADLLSVIDKINEAYPELEVRQSTCEDYLESVLSDLSEKGIEMDKAYGELMYTYEQVLESTHACHPRQKQRHYKTERYMERVLEPMTALAYLAGFDSRIWAQDRAWKYVLENHAHDTLGCTSVDEVYEQAMARYGCAISLAEQVAEDCRRDVMMTMKDEESLVIFNTSSFKSNGVYEFELDVPEGYGGENFALEDEDGKQISVVLIDKDDVIDLRFNPRTGHPTTCNAKHIKALAEIPDVDAFGWRRLRLVPNGTPTFYPTRRMFYYSPAPCVMENEYLRCVINPNGTVDMTDKLTGYTYKNQFTFEDNGDVETMYVHLSPFMNKTVYSSGAQADISLIYDTPLGCRYEVALTMHIPMGADGTKKRSDLNIDLPITLILTLNKGARRLDAEIKIDNRACEHRLRVLFPTDLTSAQKSRGGQPFDVVERDIQGIANLEGVGEQPYPTHPMQDICDVSAENRGLTVAAEGIYEYECIDVASRPLALTLLRCINRIATNWTIHAKETENIGTITYKLSLLPHGSDWREVYGDALRFLNPPKLVLNRMSEESVLPDYVHRERTLPDKGAALQFEGENCMISSLKTSYCGNGIAVRVLNYGEENAECKLGFTYPGMKIKEAFATDLDEKYLETLSHEDSEIKFKLRKSGLFTMVIIPERI